MTPGSSLAVIAGLVPAIHWRHGALIGGMDARDKPGHDLRRRRVAPYQPALVDAFRLAIYLFPKIPPFRIATLDRSDLPGARPVLDRLFSLDCRAGLIKRGKPNQPTDTMAFGEARDKLFTVFIHTANQVVRDSGIERSVFAAGQNVDIKRHSRMQSRLDRWHKPCNAIDSRSRPRKPGRCRSSVEFVRIIAGNFK